MALCKSPFYGIHAPSKTILIISKYKLESLKNNYGTYTNFILLEII